MDALKAEFALNQVDSLYQTIELPGFNQGLEDQMKIRRLEF